MGSAPTSTSDVVHAVPVSSLQTITLVERCCWYTNGWSGAFELARLRTSIIFVKARSDSNPRDREDRRVMAMLHALDTSSNKRSRRLR